MARTSQNDVATFAPIAIVGQSCVLPGAHSPEALWEIALGGVDQVTSAPLGRWGLSDEHALTDDTAHAEDRAWSSAGGYVTGFEDLLAKTLKNDPFELPNDQVLALDPLFQWVLYTGRQALRDAKYSGSLDKVGAVFGNLGFPSAAMSRFAETTWLGSDAATAGIPVQDATNRYMSGLPAHLLAKTLGLGAGALALDAACASSLYAIKLACDRLHDGDADLMLAGAVCSSDSLFIHVGFCALNAMSKTGQSRPFHADADGLVPGEGAAMVALKRLEDAERDGDEILGVIRGVGLSNDGRGRGLLAPSASGQVRAMERAYAESGISPNDVSFVECHATGTTVGDATELESMATVFGDRPELPIGSLKGNLGHLITTAGAAGLIKVLAAMKHGVRPPSINADKPNPALKGTCFRPVLKQEPWNVPGTRIAAVSAFGFGGNNAHLLVESYEGPTGLSVAPTAVDADLVIVGMGVRAATAATTGQFKSALFAGKSLLTDGEGRSGDISLPLKGLRFPPNDLKQTLPQQIALLGAALEAVDQAPTLSTDRTGVFIGCQSDPEVCRYGARWRVRDWAAKLAEAKNLPVDPTWVSAAMDAVVPVLKSAGVVGNMPNIPANRISSQFDFGGPGFTMSSEELSGLSALRVASRMLRAGDIDAALVGAVDLCCEPVHKAAIGMLPSNRQTPGDAAVVLILKRLEDAKRDGDAVIAVLPSRSKMATYRLGTQGTHLAALFGHAHAASSLLHVAAAALSVRDGVKPSVRGPASDWNQETRTVRVEFDAMLGATASVLVTNAPADLPLQTDDHMNAPASAVLTFPAHPRSVRLPELTMPEPTYTNAVVMPTPPTLPSALIDPPAALAGATGFEREHFHTSTQSTSMPTTPNFTQDMASLPATTPLTQSMAPIPATLPPVPDFAPAPPVAIPTPAMVPPTRVAVPGAVPASGNPIAAMQAHLAEVHAAFLAQQAMVHHKFLATRQNAVMQLLTHRAGAQQPPAVPTMPTMPVPPAPAHQAKAPVVMPLVPPSTITLPPPEKKPLPPLPPRVSAKPVVAKTPVKAAPNAKAPPKKGDAIDLTTLVLTPPAHELPGPKYDRAQLEILAGDKISKVFPEMFKVQDDFRRQVRMPEPPLLLADRVTGIDAVPGSMTKGTLWSETDITHDAWYIHQGHCPPGIMIEAGQADLLLISWLGADFANKGERVYRLLGCDLTYHGGLPAAGETMQYEIHVDGHANQGDTRIFFFHSDGRSSDGKMRLAVREGQAGFFTDEELANSGGILWSPEDAEICDNPRLADPMVDAVPASYTSKQIAAFSNGKAFDCFGAGYELLQTHVRTPRISVDPYLYFDTIEELNTDGGPWKRGYLKATQNITPHTWFFDGHFKDDPCMPGTLMFDGCLQALSFYMAAMGYTMKKDGWRFEPVPDTAYSLLCRGQVTPTNKKVTYEIFIEERVVEGNKIEIWADFLCTVDGLKAFWAKRVGMQLTYDYPLSDRPELLAGYKDPVPVATKGGFEYGYHSLMACAWGKPSEAFGPFYSPFDGGRHCARLPGPPYHFMTRLTKISSDPGAMDAKTEIELEYDIPEDAWYFDKNGNRTMPFAVLLEAALQPCGWIACYIGSALTTDQDLYFRNLDGTGNLTGEIWPDTGTLTTKARCKSVAHAGGMIIESFDVECYVGDVCVYTMDTVFGFFPTAALANQLGMPPKQEERDSLLLPCDFLVDLTVRPEKYCGGACRLPDPMLLMLDRVVGFWPEGGAKGIGRLVSEKDVNPDEWFFKAHFFTDPVQPGSLGIEAMIQLLQFYMLHEGMDDGMKNPRFEPLALGKPMTWKYRGQVVPKNKVIRCEIDITEIGEDEDGRYAICDSYLWVDDLRIYQAKNLGMRITDGPNPKGGSKTLDPKADSWLDDHCPTWTVAALPAMSMADQLAEAALGGTRGKDVIGLRKVQVKRWMPIDGPTLIRNASTGDGDERQATLALWREARDEKLSRYEPACEGTVLLGESYPKAPKAWAKLKGGKKQDNPYQTGALFHGPAFQYLTSLQTSGKGSSAILDCGAGSVPHGVLNQGVLDALTHGIPHDSLDQWSEKIGDDLAAYPWLIERLDLYAPLPTSGELRVEARYDGFAADRQPRIKLQAVAGEQVICELDLVEILLPKGPIGEANRSRRLDFLRDRKPANGLGLSTTKDGDTHVDLATIKGSDWLPGTVKALYNTDESDLVTQIAVKDHVARLADVHPGTVRLLDGGAISDALPLTLFPLAISIDDDGVAVRSAGDEVLSTQETAAYWDQWFQAGRWPVEDIYYGLIRRFMNRVHVVDPEAHKAIYGRSCLYLGNHQVAVESLLASIIGSYVHGVNTVTVAKTEHRTTWMGELIRLCFDYPGIRDPEVITFFDRTDRRSLFGIIKTLGNEMVSPGKSVLVHVEGTRSLSCGSPVQKLGSAFLDMAMSADAPVVPIRFVGALPTDDLDARIEYPLNMGQQDLWLGAPILPETLAALPLRERKQYVLDAINNLGPKLADERPFPGDAAFEARAHAWMKQTGATHEHATLYCVLQDLENPSPPTQKLLAGAASGTLLLNNNPEDTWLGKLAERLFGDHGPKIVTN